MNADGEMIKQRRDTALALARSFFKCYSDMFGEPLSDGIGKRVDHVVLLATGSEITTIIVGLRCNRESEPVKLKQQMRKQVKAILSNTGVHKHMPAKLASH
eukprot:3163540-Pyramimonas_sp.AAC.1